MEKERSPSAEPDWLDEALDEFSTVFGPDGASETSSKAYIEKWIRRCKTEAEEEAFQESLRAWLHIRAAVICSGASHENKVTPKVEEARLLRTLKQRRKPKRSARGKRS